MPNNKRRRRKPKAQTQTMVETIIIDPTNQRTIEETTTQDKQSETQIAEDEWILVDVHESDKLSEKF